MRFALAQLNFTVGAFDANFTRIATPPPRRARRAPICRADGAGDDRISAAGSAESPRASSTPISRCAIGSRACPTSGSASSSAARTRTRRRRQAALQHRHAVPRRADRRAPPQDAAADVRRLRRGSLFRARHHGRADDLQGRPARRHGVRGDLERRGVLAAAPVSSRSDRGAGGRRRGDLRQHLVEPVHDRQGEPETRDDPAAGHQHGLPFLYVNQVGGNDELIFDGHSIGFAGDGTLLCARGTSTRTSS